MPFADEIVESQVKLFSMYTTVGGFIAAFGRSVIAACRPRGRSVGTTREHTERLSNIGGCSLRLDPACMVANDTGMR